MKKIANQLDLQFQLSSYQPNPSSFRNRTWEVHQMKQISNVAFSGRTRNRTWSVIKKMYDWKENSQSQQNSWFSLFSNKENRKPACFSKTIISSTKNNLSGIKPETSIKWNKISKHNVAFPDAPGIEPEASLKRMYDWIKKQLNSKEQLVFAFLEWRKSQTSSEFSATILYSTKPVFQESNLSFQTDSKNQMSLFWTRQESNLKRP